ncbi:DUF1611 domain-containing protein [Henriciella litoralis]|uniref:DUF1611 domain-containing protein n=1 Tax=Henriciella litoralis TaxID=568102 RepID=UPI001F33B414|nr:DUF1611 domain-containing protein [Henriciella litoralis]
MKDEDLTMTGPVPPYLVFLGDEHRLLLAKTGVGIAQWAPERCIGQYRLSRQAIHLGLQDLSPEEAVAKGAKSLVIGVAGIGGAIPPAWRAVLHEALEAGLDIVAGMHERLHDDAELAERASKLGRRLVDLRDPPADLSVGTGKPRSGRRVLTVGTDCAVGKKFTALAVWRELRARGEAADFCATGQTGVLISGKGFAIDSVVSDFISGAAERLAPANDPAHWDVIEGQGSIFHPAYAGVSLGLLHGSQPEAIILCHEAGRERLGYFEDFPTPPLDLAIARHLEAARLTSPDVRCAGISLNTKSLAEGEALALCKTLSAELHLPVTDPIRMGAGPLVDRLLSIPPKP